MRTTVEMRRDGVGLAPQDVVDKESKKELKRLILGLGRAFNGIPSCA